MKKLIIEIAKILNARKCAKSKSEASLRAMHDKETGAYDAFVFQTLEQNGFAKVH